MTHPRPPLPRSLLRLSLSLCPIDGAVTWDSGTLTEHSTLRGAALHVVTHPGTRIVSVGSAVNQGTGLTVIEEEAALDSARSAMTGVQHA